TLAHDVGSSRGSSLESDSPNLTKYHPRPSKGEINTTKQSSSSNHFIWLKLCKVSNNHFVMLPYLQSSAPPKLKVQGQYRQGKKEIWLKLPVKKSELEGFEYHHAEKGYVMLTYWIPESRGGALYASCKCFTSKEIFSGAVREVKEETGPLSHKIIIDNLEIKAAKWMPLVEFVEQPMIKGEKMFKPSLYYNVVHDDDPSNSNCTADFY
ncbi:hypothetical protein HID58_033544, partial [Brassica napus]